MTAHAGWLYVGTFDWSVFLPYAQRHRMLLWLQRHLNRFGVENILKHQGGFDFWRSPDGLHWHAVTLTGLGNPYNYGVRTLVSTPFGLGVGTANPFGPLVAARLAAGWTYVPNPNGGAEVWLGGRERP